MEVFDMDTYNLTLIGSTLGICLIIYTKYDTKTLVKKCLKTCVIKCLKLRSDYMWKTRNKTPLLLKHKLDKILKIDTEIATLNSSDILSERIFIEECSEISKKGVMITSRLMELDGLKPLIDLKNSNGFLFLNKNQVFKLFGMQEYPWYLKISYIGHSNIQKRVNAGRYTVIYKMEEDSPFMFPPYSTKDSIQVGFSAPKVKSATLITGEIFDLNSVKQHSGLKYDFYETCDIKEVVKGYINNTEDVLVSLKNKNIVVNDEL